MPELKRDEVSVFKEKEKNSFIIVLDDVRSALNVGSAFRTADAFAAHELILCGITATPPHKEILKTALGATNSVRWEYEKDIIEKLTHYKNMQYKIYAVEQVKGSISLNNFIPETNTFSVFIFGNEVNGVSDKVLKFCHNCLEIPQFGTKHSLNIAVTVGIIAWDYIYKTKY